MEQIRVKTSSNFNDEEITDIKLLGVATSLREDSHSTHALKILLEVAANKYGAKARLLELRKTKLPLYNPSIESTEITNGSILEVTEAVIWADAFVLASPDYHGSMSGTMKNFLDYFWKEFAGKTFGYLCTSHEKGLTVMDQMRTAVRQCYGWSMPYGVSVNGERDFNAKGEINNTILARRLNMLARDLVVYGRLIKEQFQKDLAGDTLDTFAARYRK
jgi:NAD(P)H-dependent FMN reductase